MPTAKFKHNINKPGVNGQTYNYRARNIWFNDDSLCPDCTTPGVWVEDDDPDRPYVAYQYHDATCPDALSHSHDWRWPIWNPKGPNKSPDECFLEWKLKQ